MYFAIATAINDWYERTFHGRRFVSPMQQLSPFDADAPRGHRPHPPIRPVGVPGDTLASIDNLIGLPQTESGHWKAAQAAGLNPELEQVRASAYGELTTLNNEIEDLRARLAAAEARAAEAEARAAAAEARACTGACASNGSG